MTLALTIVDIGGIPSQENLVICKDATHIILLAGNDPKDGTPWQERLPEWRAFAEELGLVVVAEVFSDYHGTEDVVTGLGSDDVLRGSVHHLERGEAIASRPTVRALAARLVELAPNE